MPEVTAAKKRIVKLCAETKNDPFEIVGLVSLHALAAGDIAKVTFWKTVAERLRALGPPSQ